MRLSVWAVGRRFLNLTVVLSLLLAFLPAGVRSVSALSTTVVISQVYGGGGNSGAVYTHDFIELFNRGASAVSLSGWSVQYTSAAGTGNFGSATNLITPLAGTLAPGQYLLIQEATNAAVGAPLPTPDVTDATPINMSGTGGKVALVNTITPLGCNGGSTPCSPAALATVVDLIGWDGANFFEGSGPAPATTNATAALRVNGGCQETDDNSADFVAGAPTPRNTASPFHSCGGGDQPPMVASTDPAGAATDAALDASITVNFSEPVNLSGAWFDISCATSGGHTAAVSGGPQSFVLDPDSDFANSDSCTVTVVAAQVSDQDSDDPPDTMDADYVWSFTTLAPPPPPALIHEIQGAGHISPKNGQGVSSVPGIVTALRTSGSTRGFYLQDPNPDADPATSEGIFVFTGSSSNPATLVAVGDALTVGGQVSEFRPGGASSTNLTITEIVSPVISLVSSGNPLPAPVVLGTGGQVPPAQVIEDDASGDVETSGVFDPTSDGIDFYESLEGMLAQVNDAVATGPTSDFGSNREISVLGDNGANAAVRTTRGGIIVRPADFNPERIILNDLIAGGPLLPPVNVGDSFPGTTLGVIDYSFGNFKLEVITLPALVSGGLAPEVTAAPGLYELAAGTLNVENLDANDPQDKFDALAGFIVHNLQSPDLLAVEEIQDNNGPTNDPIVDASLTFDRLISAVQAAGGPVYDYSQIDPVDDEDGGEPGGNIRVGFLFRSDRGLSFIERPGGSSTAATSVVAGSGGPELSFSPGRIDPTNAAFTTSRKPLAGEFSYYGHKLFAVANHFNSKGGDQPLFGRFQPPTRSTEVQRNQQAQVVNDFVDAILAVDPNAGVIVLGDFNDFEFSDALNTLKGSVLFDLVETLPQAERYTYVFEGNSQALDHTLLSGGLFNSRPFEYDVVHVNSEFSAQASDHEPQVTRLTINDPPTVSAGGPYSVVEGSSVLVTALGSDFEGGALTYAWDLDNNSSFETPGQSVSFSAPVNSAPATRTIRVQATDPGGLSAVASTTVNILYLFSGFFAPVDNPPVLNSVNSGRLIPIKFSLGGDRGLNIFAPGYPKSEKIACTTSAPLDDIEETLTGGSSGLQYDPATGQYTYVWKTEKGWANTCRKLILKLNDGTEHIALFKFTK